MLVCIAVIATQAYELLVFIRTQQPNAPAYERRMTIDAATYVQRAVAMLIAREPLYTPDAIHSVGMQVLTATVFRVASPHMLPVKLMNWALWLATIVLALLAFRRVLPSVTAAWLTATAVALSIPLQRYAAIVQYEVPAAALLTTIFLLNAGEDAANARRDVTVAAASGVLAAVLAIFRAHFVLLVPMLAGVYAVYPSTRNRARWLALIAGFLTIALPWNAYYSVRRGSPFFFQAVGQHVDRYLSPTSAGYNYPYPAPARLTGVEFVVERPAGYAQLLARRLTYLAGIERDYWWIEPRGARLLRLATDGDSARRINAVVALTLTLAGAALILRRETRTRGGVLAVGIIAVLIAPHAVLNSSTRFMVPAIPLLTMLQAQTVVVMLRRTRRRPA